MNEEQQQQNEEHQQIKIHIKNEQQQQHKSLTRGSPKQSNIAGSFWLLILKNDYCINYNKKVITKLIITKQKKFLYKKFIKKVTTIVYINLVVI